MWFCVKRVDPVAGTDLPTDLLGKTGQDEKPVGRRPQVIVDGQMGRPRPGGCEGLGCEITDCDLRRVSSVSLSL